MDGLEWQRSKYNKPTQRFLKWAEALAAKHAHTLIADSPGIQEHLFKTYGKKPVFIPYGAEPFSHPDASVLAKYKLTAGQYFLAIARMEPENNIEMIIQGHLASGHRYPLFIIGNITNKYGKYLTTRYNNPFIKFSDAIYDQRELDNLRYYSHRYFHGHSVGGTNPSLLEAMACRCHIIAHHNRFNRAVLQDEASYFHHAAHVTEIINTPLTTSVIDRWKKLNLDKIRMIYDHEKITDAYEQLMLDACGIQKVIMEQAVAKAV
jgi:glycosyltransferase involved in cell wall biosynthesis